VSRDDSWVRDYKTPEEAISSTDARPCRDTGFWAVLSQAAFSYIGTEIVAIAAGEAKNPRKNLPKAIKLVYIRILLFYIGGVRTRVTSEIAAVRMLTSIDGSGSRHWSARSFQHPGSRSRKLQRCQVSLCHRYSAIRNQGSSFDHQRVSLDFGLVCCLLRLVHQLSSSLRSCLERSSSQGLHQDLEERCSLGRAPFLGSFRRVGVHEFAIERRYCLQLLC